MKDKNLTFLLLLIVGLVFFTLFLFVYTGKVNFSFIENIAKRTKPVRVAQPEYPEKLKLTSKGFENEAKIPEKYSCKGTDVSPPLIIAEIPSNTKSLVLIVDDPDAPYQTWTHWIVFNIDPRQKNIGENTVPWNARLGTNDFGTDDYRGPCPPSGTHRYYFRLFALDTLLSLDKGADRKKVEAAMSGHVLDIGVLMGVFEK